MTPFDHFWELYPGNRKKNKKGCEAKFNKLDLDTQKIVYKDVQERIKHYPDWQTVAHICAPEVYLNQKWWESPLEIKKQADSVRDTTNEQLNKVQEAAGIAKMRESLTIPSIEKVEVSHKDIKEVAQGMFAKRICGKALDRMVMIRDLNIDFDFVALIERCDLPKGSDLNQHEMAWSLFHREFERDFRKFVNGE